MPEQLPPIDDDVFAALQDETEPLIDDINSVLRRLLNLPSRGGIGSAAEHPDGTSASIMPEPQKRKRGRRGKPRGKKPQRAPRGVTLPESDYELPVLRALAALGGRAAASEVVDRVGELVDGELKELDHERLGSGEVRWRNRVPFVRLKLIQAGELVKESPRGIWELTELGQQRLNGGSSAQRSTGAEERSR